MTVAPPRCAMVFAAGRGERMGPLTDRCAKPALPLGGMSLLERILHRLRRAGVRKVVVNLHHAPESLQPALRRAAAAGLEVLRSEETRLLGTSGGLQRALARFAGDGFGSEPFLLLNGDALSEADLPEFAAAHRRLGGCATLLAASRTPKGFERERRLEVASDGRLAGIGPRGASGPVFCGVWLLEPAGLGLLVPGATGLGEDLLPGLIRSGGGFVFPSAAPWFEIGTPGRYLAAALSFRDGAPGGGARLAPDAVVDSPGLVGAGCAVGAGAKVLRSLLLDRATVGPGAVVRDSIVAAGEAVPPGAEVSGALFAGGAGASLP